MTLTLGFGLIVLLAVIALVLAVLKMAGKAGPLTEIGVILLAICVIIAKAGMS